MSSFNVILSDNEGSRSFAIAQDDIEVPVVFIIRGAAIAACGTTLKISAQPTKYPEIAYGQLPKKCRCEFIRTDPLGMQHKSE